MEKRVSNNFRIISSLSMIGIVFLHAKFIRSRWNETLIENDPISWTSNFFQLLISEQITRLCVPLFFVISGYFFFKNYDGSIQAYYIKLKSRYKTILIPYLFWCLFWFAIYNLFSQFQHLDSFPLALIDSIVNPIPFQLWFLQDLMVLIVFSPLLYFLINKIKQSYLFIILIMIYLLDFSIRSHIDSVVFFLLGASLFLSGNKWFLKQNFKINIYAYIILSLVFVFLEMYSLSVNHTFIFLIHKISVIIGVWTILCLIFDVDMNHLSFKLLLNKLSPGYLFFLFASHEPLLSFLKSGFVMYFKSSFNLLGYFLLPLITIFITYIIYFVLRKKLSCILFLINGNRQ